MNPKTALFTRKTAVSGLILTIALFGFELFNFDTTRFALCHLMSGRQFWGLEWAGILALAFGSLDFAGLVRVFTPEKELSQALWQLGYQTEMTWCQPYQFQPKLSSHEAHSVILKEIRVQHDPAKKLSLAKGLAVYTPALVIDDTDDTLVYLEMMGHKQSVKANWAALVGGNKVHWLGRQRISLEGMKAHVKIQTTLPCGWVDHILLHKQASLKEMNPEQPFYLLDDGTQPIPPLFYAMLNKTLALPLLPDWAGYLWKNGRMQKLITLLDKGAGQGYAAWRVLPAAKAWQEIIQTAIHSKQICF